MMEAVINSTPSAQSIGAESSTLAVSGSETKAGHVEVATDHGAINAAENAPEPQDINTKKHTGKPKKIVRSENSFRPGSSVAASKPRKPKTLLYSIPTAHGKGDASEFSVLHAFVNAVDVKLSQGQYGRFAALGLEDGCWKLSFRLNQGVDEVQDEFVSSMFQALDEVNSGASFLSEGFDTSRPANWAVSVGECVVDRGSF